MSDRFDISIIGGGLAGLSLAMHLVEAGRPPSSIAVVDGGDKRRGSSAPATMLHPFPGRTIRLGRGQSEAFVASWQILQAWRARLDGDQWWRQAPMIRPLGDDARGQALAASWDDAKANLPELIDGQIMAAAAVSRHFAGVDTARSALVYEPAAAVLLPVLTARLRQVLADQGVHFVDAQVERFERRDQSWQMMASGQVLARSAKVVLAMGPWLQAHFPDLDLRCRAGEVAVVDPGGSTLEATVNGAAHLFVRPDGLWGLGSTYFGMPKWDERRDSEVGADLCESVAAHVPAMAEAAIVEIWRGVRGVFGSDHLPLVGPVPNHEGLFCLGAFGSKGLLWAPAASAMLAHYLAGDGDAIAAPMRTERIKCAKWQFVADAGELR